MKFTRKSADRFEEFMDAIDPLLQKEGSIRTGDAWDATGRAFNYTYFSVHFNYAMTLMVEQGKARKERNGHWTILIPNKKHGNKEM